MTHQNQSSNEFLVKYAIRKITTGIPQRVFPNPYRKLSILIICLLNIKLLEKLFYFKSISISGKYFGKTNEIHVLSCGNERKDSN